MENQDLLRIVDMNQFNRDAYAVHLADCLVLTQDNKILMQRRPDTWRTFPGCVNLFGGHVEPGEDFTDAVIRELHEETGAVADKNDVIFVGAVTESCTGYTEVIHVHLWHDKHGTITGCYEAEAITFDKAAQALAHPKIMDYAAWAINGCLKKGLIKL